QEEEIAVTNGDKEFQKIYGDTEKIVAELKKLIGDPEEATEVINDKYSVIFIRRRNGRHKIWTFRKEDLPKVAKLLGRRLKGEWDKEDGLINIEHLHLKELLNEKDKQKRDGKDRKYEYELDLVK
ncbi:hypothetical protein ACFL52_03595, partial [Candidatus Margulisiibacteriota bacterium]